MFLEFENQVKDIKNDDDEELLIERTSSNKFDKYKEKMK